ncbi:MAG: hypothetical protein JWO33_1040 [Caulobacteraceae bacterium]|nr:hypothetical protein [Caulobacteraceae bacterium]
MSATAYTEHFDFARVTGRAYDVVRRNFTLLVALTAILYGLPKLGATFLHLTMGDHGFFHFVFGLTAGFYALIACFGFLALQSAVVHAFAADLNDRPASIGACLRTGLTFLLPVLGLFLVYALGVAFGLVLLIVPGLFLATIWAVSMPGLVVERLGVGDALRRSAQLTQGYRWQLFGIGAVFVLISSMIHGALDHGGPFSDGFGIFSFAGRVARELIVDIVDSVFALIGAVLTTSVYYELRLLKEDAGPEELAAILD